MGGAFFVEVDEAFSRHCFNSTPLNVIYANGDIYGCSFKLVQKLFSGITKAAFQGSIILIIFSTSMPFNLGFKWTRFNL
jgi:hypothetical protein